MAVSSGVKTQSRKQIKSCIWLYHEWGLHGYRYHRTNYLEGGIVFTIKPRSHQLQCGGGRVMRQGKVSHRFLPTSIGGKPVQLELAISRPSCPSCDKTRQIKLYFADKYVSYTHTFGHYNLELSWRITIWDLA